MGAKCKSPESAQLGFWCHFQQAFVVVSPRDHGVLLAPSLMWFYVGMCRVSVIAIRRYLSHRIATMVPFNPVRCGMRILLVGEAALTCYRANGLDESGMVYLGAEPVSVVGDSIVLPASALPRQVLAHSSLVWADGADTRLIMCAADRESIAIAEALEDFPWLIRGATRLVIVAGAGGRVQQRCIQWLRDFAGRHAMASDCVDWRIEQGRLCWSEVSLEVMPDCVPSDRSVAPTERPLLIALDESSWCCIRKVARADADVIAPDVLPERIASIRGKAVLLVLDLDQPIHVGSDVIVSLGQRNRVWPLLLWPGSDSGRNRVSRAQGWAKLLVDGCFAVPMVAAVDSATRPTPACDDGRLRRRMLRNRVDRWLSCWRDKCQTR